MATTRYTPSSHQKATKEELRKISDELKFNLGEGELEANLMLVNEALTQLSVIDELSDFIPEVKYPRTTGYRPGPEDRCGNAWAWKCSISGASWGKLLGKTVALKDNTAVAGVPMSNGSKLLDGYIPEYDATVVNRILDAGGVIKGKASCDDFCLSAMGYSSVDGYISLPQTPDLRVGGSSGGSAALVAAGEVDLALGGDQGGSIRIPSAWTGCVGIKPTYGLVPYTGIVSIEPNVDHTGPIAKNVHDCALFLEVLAGYDNGLDPRQPPNISVPEYSKLLDVDVSGKKIGVLKEGFDTCVPATQTAVKDFLQTIAVTKMTTEEVSVPLHAKAPAVFFGHLSQGIASFFRTGATGQWSKGFRSRTLAKAITQGLESNAKLLSSGAKHLSLTGEVFARRYGNEYYCKCSNLVTQLTRQYDDVLKDCDVIVMPTLTHTTVKFPETSESQSETDKYFNYLKVSTDMIANTVVQDMTGHPALSLPLGALGDGTKDSIMIVGKKFDDLTVLQVAKALENIISERKTAGK